MSRRFCSILLLSACMLWTVAALAGPREDQRARNAGRVLDEIQRIPEQSIPTRLLDEGRAIIIIPDTVKAGLIFGGRHGRGLMSVKTDNGTWSNPVFVKLTGGSVGFQAGVQFSDVVLVFRNDRTLDNIVNGKFTLGADASVAAGPVGRHAGAATDGKFHAEIWSWSRARGLFAGVALDGAALHIDDEANHYAYGPYITARMIFENRLETAPSADLVGFRDRLEEASYSAHNRRGNTVAPVRTASSSTTPPPASVSPPAQTTPENTATVVYPLSSGPTADDGFVPVSDDVHLRGTTQEHNPIHTEALE